MLVDVLLLELHLVFVNWDHVEASLDEGNLVWLVNLAGWSIGGYDNDSTWSVNSVTSFAAERVGTVADKVEVCCLEVSCGILVHEYKLTVGRDDLEVLCIGELGTLVLDTDVVEEGGLALVRAV